MRVPRDGLELLEDRDRLRCKGYAVGAAHLHARAWDRPERLAKVYFGPVRGSQFAGPDERKGEQLLPSANFGHAVIRYEIIGASLSGCFRKGTGDMVSPSGTRGAGSTEVRAGRR